MIGRSPNALKAEPNEGDVLHQLSANIQKPVPIPFNNSIWGALNQTTLNPGLFKPGADPILEAFTAIFNNQQATALANELAAAQKSNTPELYVDVCNSSPLSSNQSSVDICSQASHSATETSSSPSPHSVSGGSRRSSVSQELNGQGKQKHALVLPPTRIYRRVNDDIRKSNEYMTKRLRNNDAVRRSRENSKLKREQERDRYGELLDRYNALVEYIQKCKCTHELPDFLKEESKA